jgi:carbonic anhydrase
MDTYPDDEMDAKYRRLEELNVLEQARNVVKSSAVQKSYNRNKFPIVHAWIFDLKDGVLSDLKLDFAGTLAAIKKIYNLEGAAGSLKGSTVPSVR